MNKTILSLFFLAIIGLTTNVEARTECAALSCSASFCGTGIFLSQDPNIIGCTRSEKCSGAGYVCAATSNGYRLTTKCAVMECPEGCKSCCSSTNGKAICTRCEEGYKASGDDCVPIHGDLPRCDINENTYPTKIKCLANCTSGVCKNCMDIEVMTSAWQCEEHEVLCTVSNCKTCLPGKNECATCDEGYFRPAGSDCVICPKGPYCPDGNATKPTDCPAGTSTQTTGAKSVSECVAPSTCPGDAILYTSFPSSICAKTLECMQSGTKKYYCDGCKDGYTWVTGPNGCSPIACPSGKILLSSKPANCSNYEACVSSGNVKYYCNSCDDGYEWNSSTNTCRMVACPPGKYYDSGVCKLCTAGTYSNTAAATSCTNCQAGYWSEEGASACTKVDCSEFDPQHGRCVLCTHYGCDELECDENYEANYLTKTCESSSTVQSCMPPFVFDENQKCCIIPPSSEQG